MAKKEVREVWVADDGSEHSTQQGAEAVDAKVLAVRALNESDIYWRDTSADEVVDFFLGNKDALDLLVKAAGF